MSSASRTTFSSNDNEESADESWTTVGRLKAPKAVNAFTLKLSPHRGLKHLESKITPRTPNASARFAMLSIVTDGKESESGEDDAVSPRTPCQRRR